MPTTAYVKDFAVQRIKFLVRKIKSDGLDNVLIMFPGNDDIINQAKIEVSMENHDEANSDVR